MRRPGLQQCESSSRVLSCSCYCKSPRALPWDSIQQDTQHVHVSVRTRTTPRARTASCVRHMMMVNLRAPRSLDHCGALHQAIHSDGATVRRIADLAICACDWFSTVSSDCSLSSASSVAYSGQLRYSYATCGSPDLYTDYTYTEHLKGLTIRTVFKVGW